jgi:hypothetical protein
MGSLSKTHRSIPGHNEDLDRIKQSNLGDMYQSKPETSKNPPREQLPPLSSLFGTTSTHPNRPNQSTFSDRQSPIFPAAALDSRQSTSASLSERAYDGPYLQRPSPSRQYSFGSRNDQSDRQSLQPPPRPNLIGGRSKSPIFDPFGGPPPVRTQLPSSSTANKWPPQSQPPRSEYFSRDTSSSFRPNTEYRPHPSPVHRPEQDSRPTYRDGHALNTPTYPPTPTSTVACEVITGKDGLGPKIWTGTQFLPRFVRQADVPGEGMCYFYDDGTHCKTIIDGEIVNAHWGVTKAGKPRKRLAIACITCREKKIKCDPDYPRCIQCEKFGRVCKFKNA